MHTPTLLQIVTHIPLYVWGILAFIAVMGVRQSRTTTMSARRVVLLPLAWLAFGAWSVEGSFGLASGAGLAWAAGLAAGAALVRAFGWPGQVRFDSGSQSFIVAGSWLPMGLMLGLFGVKFASGMSLALHPDLARNAVFAVSASLVFGLFSGVFLGRAVHILGRRRAHASTTLQAAA